MTEKLDKLEKVRLIISLCDWDERLSQLFYSCYIIWCNNADMGCNKFLTQPIRLEILELQINSLFRSIRSLVDESQNFSIKFVETFQSKSVKIHPIRLFDRKASSERLDGLGLSPKSIRLLQKQLGLTWALLGPTKIKSEELFSSERAQRASR